MSSSNHLALRDAAVGYAQNDFPIFPIHGVRYGQCTCGKNCGRSAGKHPIVAGGFKVATTDISQIEKWWQDHPNANIGLATGTGVMVVDVDGPKGRDAIAALTAQHGPLPDTATVETSRGLHYFFMTPEDCRIPCSSGNGLEVGLDVRGDGGYVVASPSNHISGHTYKWRSAGISDAPTWLLDWARNRRGAARPIENNTSGLGELPPHLNKPSLGPDIFGLLDGSLRTAWSPAEQARLELALQAIPSDAYQTWVTAGMALQALRWEANDLNIGFQLWDRWSQGTPAKYSAAMCEEKWKSFGRTRSGITVGTVYHLAQQYGWNPPTLVTDQPALTNGQPVVSIFGATPLLPQSLKAISADTLLSARAPRRCWFVERFIPAAEVTMIGGDGGTGKTTLALQLAISSITGDNWLGLPVNKCNIIYVSAEDPEPEVHYRLEQVTKHRPVPPNELRQLTLIDLAGKDATLAYFDRGFLKPTQLSSQIEEIACERNAGCIIFDAVADFFGGNENERREVRAFVGFLRGLAMRLNAAVVFLAHPSVDGIKTGRGYSGSTHWNNAVRSRLYFTDGPKAKEEDSGAPIDPDTRILELAKSNRARRGEQIQLFWFDGRFVVTSPGASGNSKNDSEADELFLHLLSKANGQGLNLSPHHSPSFAPTNLAKMPGARGIGKAALERAMHRLIEQGKIRVETFGPRSKQRSRLIVD